MKNTKYDFCVDPNVVTEHDDGWLSMLII